ncbi:hypothetical protein OG705_14070 [Streptomyces sp. NBC_00838]|uniref:hypothetical protein n=1 Tax=Streptomyces sp. NBC_00838 TaxID=2903680 RepID=UPI00386FDD64|nr:hypothetical protein OG705_14070 [Streptomyces sp. NBC_00838]
MLDTLALVHEQKTAQCNANCALRAELAAGEGRLARLESLYTSLLESLPDLGVSPEQSEQEPAPDDTEPTPEPEPESQQPNASEEAPQNDPPSLPGLVLELLATSDKPLHAKEIAEAVLQLHAQGLTHHLGRSKRPSEDVRTALNRLALKELVVKVDRGAYEIARTAAESEAA